MTTTTVSTNERIRDYWNARARERDISNTATTDDVYLRELEISTFVDTLLRLPLPTHARIADIGCGDGYSTISIARRLQAYRFTGIDYSEEMITLANKRLRLDSGPDNVSFESGDVLTMQQSVSPNFFDAVLTDRCLINLDCLAAQSKAIEQIALCIKPGGFLVAIENFVEGQQELTLARQNVALPEISVRWHNRFLSERELNAMAAPFFEPIEYMNFSSSYYLATRVIYSALCQSDGVAPDYRHEIHRIATKLPWSGNFSPIRLAVMRRKENMPT